MLIALANHNPDIQKLLERGYALRLDGSYLVVMDIPYLDANGDLQVGAFVSVLIFADQNHVSQEDHRIFFAGNVPYGLDNTPVPNLGGSADANITLVKTDIVVTRWFSNKPMTQFGRPRDGFADHYEKIEHYTKLISGPAIEKYGASPYTFAVDNDVISDSVFKYHDTLTSRAEIGDLTAAFKDEVIAIIGLGGTGSYLLDFLAKTPVKEIRAFDGDRYHIHNAYRSPGAVQDEDWDKPKAQVYARRYENFRHGLHLHQKYIDRTSQADLDGVSFVFVCVDKGEARKEIFDLLEELGLPFIDVGLGLNRKQGPLAGTIRSTYYSATKAAEVREMGWAEEAGLPDDEYRRNVQIAELNALNAAIAVIRYKQIKGFYVEASQPDHLLLGIDNLKLLSETL